MSSVKNRRSKKRPRSKKPRPLRDKLGRFVAKKKYRRTTKKKPRPLRDKLGRFTVRKKKQRAVKPRRPVKQKQRRPVKQKPRRPVPKKPKQTFLLPPPEITQKGDSFFVHVDGYPLDFIVRYVMTLANDYIVRFLIRYTSATAYKPFVKTGEEPPSMFSTEWWNFKETKFAKIYSYLNSKGEALVIVYAPMK